VVDGFYDLYLLANRLILPEFRAGKCLAIQLLNDVFHSATGL
jgi:hypothetical protein